MFSRMAGECGLTLHRKNGNTPSVGLAETIGKIFLIFKGFVFATTEIGRMNLPVFGRKGAEYFGTFHWGISL